MKKRLALLIAGLSAAWLLAAYPAYLVWGETAVVYSAVALALCLLPTAATLAWAGWADRQSAEQQLGMVLGGTGVRMFFVLGAGLVLYYSASYFQHQSFWLWILAFYMIALTLETLLIVRGRSQPAPR